MPRREASANARCNRVELEGGGEVRSLVLRTQLGLKQHASRRAFEDAVVALNDLAAYPGDDSSCDKWLYQAISRAVENKVTNIHALLLADVLKERLERRADAWSFTAVALGAGASVNAARLQLNSIVTTPSLKGAKALAAKGAWSARAITTLLYVMSTEEQCRVQSISPREYADKLRATLWKGAFALETASPELADIAWTCRRTALEVLVAVAPEAVDVVTSEALHGLSTHKKMAPASVVARVQWFSSLDGQLDPWRATPHIMFEWCTRRAITLDASGDKLGAARVRARGRAQLGDWPLFHGVLYCSDLGKQRKPTIALAEANRCFNCALEISKTDQYISSVWRRAWIALSNAPTAFGHYSDSKACGYSHYETVLLTLARHEWGKYMKESSACNQRADACWLAASFAAKRSALDKVATHSKSAEGMSSAQRAAMGYAATGLVVLRRATDTRTFGVAAALLKRASLRTSGSAVPWIGIANCLDRLKRDFDAAAAAAWSTCYCIDEASIFDAVTCYSRAVVNTMLPPSLLDLLQSSGLMHVKDVLRKRLGICERQSSISTFITAAEELATCDVARAALTLSRASIALVRRGSYTAGAVLANYCMGSPGSNSATDSIACCSLALAIGCESNANNHYRDVTHEASALSGLEGLHDLHSVHVEHLALATALLRDAFASVENVICEIRSCGALARLVPQLHSAIIASSAIAALRSGSIGPSSSMLVTVGGDSVVAPFENLCCCEVGTPPYFDDRHHLLRVQGKPSGNVAEAHLAIALDEALIHMQRRAAAEIGLEMFATQMHLANISGATNALGSLEIVSRFPPCWCERNLYAIRDSAQSKAMIQGVLWLHLARLWLVRGCSARASKYVQRAASIKQCHKLRQAARGLELCLAISLQDWGDAALVLDLASHDNSIDFPENIRCLEQVLNEGDLLRRIGKLEIAGRCYKSASKVLKVIDECLTESSPWQVDAISGKQSHAGLLRHCQLLISSGARLIDIGCRRSRAVATYRESLRIQSSSIMLRSSWLRYRLARQLFNVASSNTAAASEVLDLLRHAFSYARRKCEWKLAAKSARALTVAALHFVPGAVSSPLVALLAHSSLGRARHAFATSNDSNSLLSRAMAGVDDLLMGLLEVPNAGALGWCDTLETHDRNVLDRLLAPFPKTFSLVAGFISPTGHLVISRLQRGQQPITLCSGLPESWYDSDTSTSPLGTSAKALKASAAGLRADTSLLPQRSKLLFTSRSNHTAARRIWWCQRHSLDSVLHAGLVGFDKSWLGAMRALFATKPASILRPKQSAEVPISVEYQIMQLCFWAAPNITLLEANTLLCASRFGVVDIRGTASPCIMKMLLRLWLTLLYKLTILDLKAALDDLRLSNLGLKRPLLGRLAGVLQKAAITSQCVMQPRKVAKARQPMILALDKQLQFLPFEALSVPRSAPISRVPSLAFALSLATGMNLSVSDTINNNIPMRACCVVDPQANLPSTRHKLAKYLGDTKTNATNGLVWSYAALGDMPPRDVAAQLTAKMPNCAAFLFCGHGYGGAYLESAVASNFMSAVLLMGCSSGALSRVGDFEAKGMALELLARGTPIVVAMLWDVTDRDIDRITLYLLQSMAKSPSCPIPDILNAARRETKLRNLNGAAPVCYGLPISLSIIEHTRRCSKFHCKDQN